MSPAELLILCGVALIVVVVLTVFWFLFAIGGQISDEEEERGIRRS